MRGLAPIAFWLFGMKSRVFGRLRAKAWGILGFRFKRVGVGFKFIKGSSLIGGDWLAVGDYCWIECVTAYKGDKFEPKLFIGNDVSLSDWVHISCAGGIKIGDGTLIGSKVYIGDHSHGAVSSYRADNSESPAMKKLGDFGLIDIGRNCWIGDGVVILAGSHIPDGSIIAANSVVKRAVERPAIIGGVPAKVIKYLES